MGIFSTSCVQIGVMLGALSGYYSKAFESVLNGLACRYGLYGASGGSIGASKSHCRLRYTGIRFEGMDGVISALESSENVLIW